MNCPQCRGEFENIEIDTARGGTTKAKRCSQCAGFLVDQPKSFEPESVLKYESPQTTYSFAGDSFECPIDQGRLEYQQDGVSANSAKYYYCESCGVYFFPKGQLSTFVSKIEAPIVGSIRTKIGSAVGLCLVLAISVLATINKVSYSFQAAEATSPLPTTGPNLFTLLLIALTYLAGTILAVLGKKMPVIIMGWAVIAICLFGFSLLIFGP